MLDMKLNTYKNYRTCLECGLKLPLTRDYFKRLTTVRGEVGFHHICKSCENEIRRNREWQDGKLLCHCCGEYKDITEFSLKGSSDLVRENKRTVCKSCFTAKQKERHLSLDDTTKFIKCLNARILGAKDRANRSNIPFNITLEYIKHLWNAQNGLCALSGLPMTYELQKGRTPTNLSIDRIDAAKGYVIGNIQLVCMACNQIKSDLSDEEMYNFCKKIVEHYEDKNKKSAAVA